MLKLSLFLSCQWLSRQGFQFSSGKSWRGAGMAASLVSNSQWGSFGHKFPGPQKSPMPRQVWKLNCTNSDLWFVSSDTQIPWRRRKSLHSVLNKNLLSCFIPFSSNSQMKVCERKNICLNLSSFSSTYISQVTLQTLLNTFSENTLGQLYYKDPLQRWRTKPLQRILCKVYQHRHLPCWIRWEEDAGLQLGASGWQPRVSTATG